MTKDEEKSLWFLGFVTYVVVFLALAAAVAAACWAKDAKALATKAVEIAEAKQ